MWLGRVSYATAAFSDPLNSLFPTIFIKYISEVFSTYLTAQVHSERPVLAEFGIGLLRTRFKSEESGGA